MTQRRKSDDRMARETGVAEAVARIAEPLLEGMGYRLVRVRMAGKDLQVMAERADGTLTIDDCVEISRALSPVLDIEDPVPGAYNLEISSPGIARPLVRPEDFERHAGHVAKIELIAPIEGRKRFRGRLEGYDAESDEVRLFIPAADAGAEGEGEKDEVLIGLKFDDIAEARLVMTDELMQAATERAQQRNKGGIGDGSPHEPAPAARRGSK